MRQVRTTHRKSFARADRVAELIHRQLSMDFVEGRLRDRRIDGVIFTITHVKLTDDLKLAKIYLQALGQTEFKKDWTKALNELAFHFKADLSRSLELRHTPQLEFLEDIGFQQGERLLNLIQSVSQNLSNSEGEHA